MTDQRARALLSVHYERQFTAQELRIDDPAWHDVELAIRRMDPFRFPIVFLLLDDDVDDERLEILGGEGAYWVAGSTRGTCQRRLLNPSGGSDEVAVWTSDQGFSDESRFVHNSLDTVLDVARHWFHYGTFHPAYPWEQRPYDAA